MPEPPPARPVALVGFMGAGKSTLGPRLAARLQRPFLDLDEEVERAAGHPIPEIFAREGEAGFRARERAALEAALAGGDAVIATGGGIVEDEVCRRRLREAATVLWLDLRFEVARARLESAGVHRRPLVGTLGWGGVEALLAARRPLYAECADFRLETSRRSPAGLLRELEHCLRGAA